MSGVIVFSSEAVRGLSFEPSGSSSVTYGPYRPRLGHQLVPGHRIEPERLVAAGGVEQLLGLLRGQLVRRHVVRHVGPLAVALEVGAVAADPDDDVGPVDRERRHVPGVDSGDVGDQGLQSKSRSFARTDRCSALAGPVAPGRGAGVLLEQERPVGGPAVGRVLRAEVEPGQPRHPLGLAAGDVVERVLHLGGERVVDQLGEVQHEQVDDREGEERGHQRGALLEHVAPVKDRADDRRVGRRAADLPVLELLDQARLGVAGRAAWWRARASLIRSADSGSPSASGGSRRSWSSRSRLWSSLDST